MTRSTRPAFDALLAAEGVDVAVVLAEYSPKVTGIQTVEDMAALAAAAPACGSPPTSTRTCTTRSTRRSPASSTSARSP